MDVNVDEFSLKLIIPECTPIFSPNEFADTLLAKNIPVERNRAIEVAGILKDEGATPDLMGKIASCFRFIGKEEFDGDVARLAAQIASDFPDGNFNITLHPIRGKSADWMLSQLLAKGMPKPAYDFPLAQPYGHLHELKRPNIAVDDWSIDGIQFRGIINSVHGVVSYGEGGEGLDFTPKIHVYALYSSPAVIKNLQSIGDSVHIISQLPITNLYDVTTPQEREILRKIRIKERVDLNEFIRVEDGTTLTFGWWKIPDAFYEMFVSPGPLGLIHIEDFYPPYKDPALLAPPGQSGRLFTHQ